MERDWRLGRDMHDFMRGFCLGGVGGEGGGEVVLESAFWALNFFRPSMSLRGDWGGEGRGGES